MAGYRYTYSVSSSSSNTEEPPQLSKQWSYDSNHHGRPVFDAQKYYDPKDFTESRVTQRENNVVERVYSSEDGAYKYVVVTKTEPMTLTRSSLEGTPAEVSELLTRILNEVSEPLQELHVTDIDNDRCRVPLNPAQDYPQRVDNNDTHRRPLSPKRDYPQRDEKHVNKGHSEPSDGRTGPSSTSYWMQLAKFKKHKNPFTKIHVSDYKNKDMRQPTKFSEAEPTRILTGPGTTSRPTGTTWPTPKGRDTSLSTPKEAASPSAYAVHPETGQDKPPVSPVPLKERYGEPINKGEVAKPSNYATAPEIGQYNPPVSTLPMKDNYGQPINKRQAANYLPYSTASGTGQHSSPVANMPKIDSYGEPINRSEHAKPSPKESYGYPIHNNETVKPSHHAATSGIAQGNNPISSMPKKDSYGEPINKNGDVKPSPYSIASADPHYTSKAAKPTSITTSSPGSLISPPPPPSHVPYRTTTSKEPMIRTEAIKPSPYITASPDSKISAPSLPPSNKYGYTETKDNKEAAKPTHATTASPVLPSKYRHVPSAPMESYPVTNARRYGSADTINSREAARLYGTADASSGAHIVNHDDEDDGLPKITSKEAAKKYGGKFVF